MSADGEAGDRLAVVLQVYSPGGAKLRRRYADGGASDSHRCPVQQLQHNMQQLQHNTTYNNFQRHFAQRRRNAILS